MAKSIKIACASDRCYFKVLPTMLNSVRANTTGEIEIAVFTEGVSSKDRNTLASLFPNLNITFERVMERTYASYPRKPTISPITYARLTMADVTGWDKFIYLDVDVIATRDLTELFQTEIEGSYIAGCYRDGKLNSGVLLVNGKTWRKEGIGYKALKWRQNTPKKINGRIIADQIAIEAICEDRVIRLDSKWNVMVDPIWGRHLLTSAYIESAAITHYVTPFKPWNLGRLFIPRVLVERWSKYNVAQTPFRTVWGREAIFLAAQTKCILDKYILKRPM